MITERIAEEASHADELHLTQFPEFVGLGIVPKRPRSSDMAVAVYVTRPESKLSDEFRALLPKKVVVDSDGKRFLVVTKVINVGELTP